MTTMTDIGVTGALFLLDTYDTSKLRNYFREKIDKAASAVSSAVEGSLGTPKAREATMDKGVEALKAALDYIRSDAVSQVFNHFTWQLDAVGVHHFLQDGHAGLQ